MKQDKQDFSGGQKGRNTSVLNIQVDYCRHDLLMLLSCTFKEQCLKIQAEINQLSKPTVMENTLGQAKKQRKRQRQKRKYTTKTETETPIYDIVFRSQKYDST